jgi:hypothetical protein
VIVMPSNNTGFDCGYLAGRFPGRIGHLHSVEAPRKPKHGVPWALDNGVFGAWQSGREWCEEPLFKYLDTYSVYGPQWVVVPDWVGDRDETLRRWDRYAESIQVFGVPLAFAVQDGMEPSDVPSEAAVIFVGGTAGWKWKNLMIWTLCFPRVHVGRVNSYDTLWTCHEAGAESCDGTGWFRGGKTRLQGLVHYLEESSWLE